MAATKNSLPASNTGDIYAKEAARYEGKTAAELEKETEKKRRRYRRLRDIIISQAKRAAGLVLHKGVAAHTREVRKEHGVVERIYQLEDKFLAYFRQQGDKILQKLKQDRILERPDGFEAARAIIIAEFKRQREAYQGFITTIFATLAVRKTGTKIPQIDLETFSRSFEDILKTVGLLGSFENLGEISNLVRGEFATGKQKNLLYEIHSQLGLGQPLSAEQLRFLGEKFLAARQERFSPGVVGKYERLALPMITMSLTPAQRFQTLENLVAAAKNSLMITDVFKDWYVAGLVSKSQLLRLGVLASARFPQDANLTSFTSSLADGAYEANKNASREFVQKQIKSHRFSLSGRNFVLQKLNLYTLIGYQIVFNGALIGALTGLFSGAMTAISNKNPKYFFSVLTHPSFLKSVAAMGVSTEWFTQHKRPGKEHGWSSISPGAVSKWLDSLGKGGKKAREKNTATVQENLLWSMTNHPQASAYFLKHQQRFHNYLLVKTKGGTKVLNPRSVLSRKQIETVTGSKLPDQIDGIPAAEVGVLFYNFWFFSRQDLKLPNGELNRLYQAELTRQGIVGKPVRGEKSAVYRKRVASAADQNRRAKIRAAFTRASRLVAGDGS